MSSNEIMDFITVGGCALVGGLVGLFLSYLLDPKFRNFVNGKRK